MNQPNLVRFQRSLSRTTTRREGHGGREKIWGLRVDASPLCARKSEPKKGSSLSENSGNGPFAVLWLAHSRFGIRQGEPA